MAKLECGAVASDAAVGGLLVDAGDALAALVVAADAVALDALPDGGGGVAGKEESWKGKGGGLIERKETDFMLRFDFYCMKRDSLF